MRITILLSAHQRAWRPVARGSQLKRCDHCVDPERREWEAGLRGCFQQPCYTGAMMDELEFRRTAESALDALKRHLIAREDEADAGFEVEEQNGVLSVLFAEPPGKFVITPNTSVRQIWISALSTSFKLDWDAKLSTFVLARTGEQMARLLERLIEQYADG